MTARMDRDHPEARLDLLCRIGLARGGAAAARAKVLSSIGCRSARLSRSARSSCWIDRTLAARFARGWSSDRRGQSIHGRGLLGRLLPRAGDRLADGRDDMIRL